MNKEKVVFLTGAAGFIGFHTALALQQKGARVIGLDNFNAYYSPALKKDRAALLQAKGIEFFEGDINDRERLQSFFQSYPFTHILHLAAQAGVRYARENPEAYLKSNVDGFLSILETLRHFPHVKLTYASSSSVYGRNQKVPFSVTDPTDQPANLYAATKKANEMMAYSYHHLYGIVSTGLRYFTVYGPWGRPDMAYFSFTQAILTGNPIHLFNQGKMQRDFTFIDDVVAGTIAALDYTGTCSVFNIGNNRPVELLEFVAILEKHLNKKATLIFDEASPGEVETTYADIEESKRLLGFHPQTQLEEGLKHFVDWFKAYHT